MLKHHTLAYNLRLLSNMYQNGLLNTAAMIARGEFRNNIPDNMHTYSKFDFLWILSIYLDIIDLFDMTSLSCQICGKTPAKLSEH